MTDESDMDPQNGTTDERAASGVGYGGFGEPGSDPSFLDLLGQIPGYVLNAGVDPSYFENKVSALRGWMDRNAPDVTVSPGYIVTLTARDWEVFVLRQWDYSADGNGNSVTVGFGKPLYGLYFTYAYLPNSWSFAVGGYWGYGMASIDISKSIELGRPILGLGALLPTLGHSIGTSDVKMELAPAIEISLEIDLIRDIPRYGSAISDEPIPFMDYLY